MPDEDLGYLLIVLTGVAAVVLEMPWWILVIWLAFSTTYMLKVETNSRKIRHED